MNTITTSRTINARAALATLVLAAGALVPATVGAGPVEDVEDSCLANAPGTADSLERWTDHCRGVTAEYRDAYYDCMRDAPGTADSRERWVDHCAAESEGVLDIG